MKKIWLVEGDSLFDLQQLHVFPSQLNIQAGFEMMFPEQNYLMWYHQICRM